MNLVGIARAWSRAFVSQFSVKLFFLSLLPLLLSLGLWGGLMWWRMQSVLDFIQAYMGDHEGFGTAGRMLAPLGLLALKTVIVPVLAMWILLPLMLLSSLMLVGGLAMPVISRHVGGRDFPRLEKRAGGSILGSVGHALLSFLIFALLSIVSLPLMFFPPVYMFVQPILWGWLTYRIMTYDALSFYASEDERKQICLGHRAPLILMGTIAGWIGTLPSALWLGGGMSFASVLFFPFFVSASLWVCIIIFIFTGLWFQHYCLAALHALRDSEVEGSPKE